MDGMAEGRMARRVASELLECARLLTSGNLEQRELYFYVIGNDGFRRRMVEPVIANLRRKVAKGVYDARLAEKAFLHVADEAARSYAKEFADEDAWADIFPRQDRKGVAKDLFGYYEEEIMG